MPFREAFRPRSVSIPTLVRIKPQALDRVGIYLQRAEIETVSLYFSDGLPDPLLRRVKRSLEDHGIRLRQQTAVQGASQEEANRLVSHSENTAQALIGLGGGRALDTAKYMSAEVKKPYYAVPTSLSNDGFCSPQSSLTVDGHRQSVATTMPYGVIVDTEACLQAPRKLWLSGVGDLVAKLTAVRDWKIAFHEAGERVDDFAALLSDASVYQFIGRPTFDLQGTQLLATALMLNGISMAVCSSSRPASGSEHLISHALDALQPEPQLHGFQVGVATYLISLLHENGTETIGTLFDQTGFWDMCAESPFSRSLWQQAVRRAPTMKENFYTVLSRPGQVDRALQYMDQDPMLNRCIVR